MSQVRKVAITRQSPVSDFMTTGISQRKLARRAGSAALLVSVAILAGCLAGCSSPQGNGGTTNQVLLDHSGGATDTPLRNDRQNAYN